MRDWRWIIFPIIMLFLFLLSQVVNRDKPQQPRTRDDVKPPRRPPGMERPGNDLKRFLEEVRQLRESEPARRTAEEPPRYTPPPPPQPIVVVHEVPVPPRPVRPQPLQRRQVEKVAVEVEVPTVLPVDEKAIAALARKTAILAERALAPVCADRNQTVAPAARKMIALLRSPNSLATAVLLKEVLDRPLSLRPYWRL